MKPRLAVVSLWAEDVPKTAHFYRDVIGLTLLAHHGDRPHFDLGGAYLAINSGKPMPAQGEARFPLLAFQVEDLDESIQQLKAHQVEMPWGIENDTGPKVGSSPIDGTSSRWVMFLDPAGNLIELVSFSQPGKA